MPARLHPDFIPNSGTNLKKNKVLLAAIAFGIQQTIQLLTYADAQVSLKLLLVIWPDLGCSERAPGYITYLPHTAG